MKWNLLWLLAGCIFLASCDDEDNGLTPNEPVTKAFTEKYPAATQVKWDSKHSYLTADFVEGQMFHTAWFDQEGQWFMTKTELDDFSLLPKAVQDSIKVSAYATWIIDDIDRIERLDKEPIYVVEVKKPKAEYELYYAQDGILVKAVPDDDNDDYEQYLPDNILTTAMQEYITNHYPGARIIEADIEMGKTEVDIIHDHFSKEVVFDSKTGAWINTHYDVSLSKVEEVVLEALKRSAYGNYDIDDIEKYETPEGGYYLFELEKGDKEVNIQIDFQGNY